MNNKKIITVAVAAVAVIVIAAIWISSLDFRSDEEKIEDFYAEVLTGMRWYPQSLPEVDRHDTRYLYSIINDNEYERDFYFERELREFDVEEYVGIFHAGMKNVEKWRGVNMNLSWEYSNITSSVKKIQDILNEDILNLRYISDFSITLFRSLGADSGESEKAIKAIRKKYSSILANEIIKYKNGATSEKMFNLIHEIISQHPIHNVEMLEIEFDNLNNIYFHEFLNHEN